MLYCVQCGICLPSMPLLEATECENLRHGRQVPGGAGEHRGARAARVPWARLHSRAHPTPDAVRRPGRACRTQSAVRASTLADHPLIASFCIRPNMLCDSAVSLVAKASFRLLFAQEQSTISNWVKRTGWQLPVQPVRWWTGLACLHSTCVTNLRPCALAVSKRSGVIGSLACWRVPTGRGQDTEVI